MKKYIPSIFTLANLACGSLAILIGEIHAGSLLLIASMFFDAMDGTTARAFNAQSELGKELDSLCDLVSFGLAPAYLYYQLAPGLSKVYLLPVLVLVLASALRLAKFNLLAPSKYFTGMPTPATAFFIVGILIAHQHDSRFITNLFNNNIIYCGIPLFLGFIMLSPLRMFSLKDMNKGLGENKFQVLLLLIFVCLLVVDFKVAIPAIVILYILLSFLHTISYNRKYP